MGTRDIDQIIDEFASRRPSVSVDQLKTTHPADDDGIWFFRSGKIEVQIESSTGNCPFLIESSVDAERTTGENVREVVDAIIRQLGIKS